MASSAFGQSTQSAPYRDASRPVAERVRDLLGRMTLEEKFWQLFMIPGDLDDPANDYSHGVFGLQISPARDTVDAARAHAKRINDIQRYFVERTRLGVPIIPFEEAVHGLVRPGATSFPQAIGLAATWDTSLMSRVAAAIAEETRSRGIRQVLSPVVNIANDPRWGRVEETYGEDPLLSSRMAVSFVSAFERAGVVATPKHFVANFGDGGRDSYPIDFDARLLDEMYFPPFHAAILEGHARSVMSAYNSVDGSPATQNRSLLTDKLRRDWGFQGFVISDAAATGGATVLHHTEASTATATTDALDAGLDVIFQSSWPQHRPYLDAFKRGLIPDSVIDSAVARVLRAKFELGLFEHPYVDVDSARLVNGSAGAPRARPRGGARVDRPAQERRRRAPAGEDDSIDRGDRRRRGRSATGRVQRPRESQDLDSGRHHRGASRAGARWSRSLRAGTGPDRARVRRRPDRRALVQRQRPHRARPARRVLRQQSPRWKSEAHAHGRSRRFRLDPQLARSRNSVRLVLGAVDRAHHDPIERRETPRRRGK